MNRITQCLHGKGTVSAVMNHGTAICQARVPRILRDRKGRLSSGTSPTAATFPAPTATAARPRTARYKGELSTTEALAFIDNLAIAGIPLVIFTGGEPSVPPISRQLADHSREAGISTALSTNGTLITDEVAGKIKACGIEGAGSRLTGQPRRKPS